MAPDQGNWIIARRTWATRVQAARRHSGEVARANPPGMRRVPPGAHPIRPPAVAATGDGRLAAGTGRRRQDSPTANPAHLGAAPARIARLVGRLRRPCRGGKTNSHHFFLRCHPWADMGGVDALAWLEKT